jgi:hypothetical protein
MYLIFQKLWHLLMKKPTTKAEIVNKEIALICLNWAKSQLDQRVALYPNSVLRVLDKKIFTKDETCAVRFVLELAFTKEARPKRALKPGNHLTFVSMTNGKVLQIPPVSFWGFWEGGDSFGAKYLLSLLFRMFKMLWV